MAIRRLGGVAISAVVAILRLLWRLRLLIVAVLLALLLQHVVCRRGETIEPCPNYPYCDGSGSETLRAPGSSEPAADHGPAAGQRWTMARPPARGDRSIEQANRR